MNKGQIESILAAARADAIPAGESGLWHVKKYCLVKPVIAPGPKGIRQIPPGIYTNLHCYTEATMHMLGDLVMQDTPDELRKHLIFMVRAHGKVLITGLGLGCVARGALANPNVTGVVVIEKNLDVLKLVQPYMPQDDRLLILHADALEYCKKPTEKFNCAWHDLWVDESQEDAKHLQVLHMEMICDLAGKVEMQGAWEFPKYFRRSMEFAGVI